MSATHQITEVTEIQDEHLWPPALDISKSTKIGQAVDIFLSTTENSFMSQVRLERKTFSALATLPSPSGSVSCSDSNADLRHADYAGRKGESMNITLCVAFKAQRIYHPNYNEDWRREARFMNYLKIIHGQWLPPGVGGHAWDQAPTIISRAGVFLEAVDWAIFLCAI